jgi:hypothetical protein
MLSAEPKRSVEERVLDRKATELLESIPAVTIEALGQSISYSRWHFSEHIGCSRSVLLDIIG